VLARTVAVIVPVLNEERALPTLLTKLQALNGRAEIIFVDGGSTDATAQQLEQASLKQPIKWIAAPRGRAKQMNAGAAATNADTLLFLHADTTLPANALNLVDQAVSRGAVGGCFKVHIASPHFRLKLAAHIINLRSRLIASATGDQAIFVTRRAFDQLGGFRSELCEDLDLVQRLGAMGQFALVDACVQTSARRWEKNGINRTIALMWALRVGFHLGISPSTLRRFYNEPR
jgi:rSAM/selenodomain-associated transferase 2